MLTDLHYTYDSFFLWKFVAGGLNFQFSWTLARGDFPNFLAVWLNAMKDDLFTDLFTPELGQLETDPCQRKPLHFLWKTSSVLLCFVWASFLLVHTWVCIKTMFSSQCFHFLIWWSKWSRKIWTISLHNGWLESHTHLLRFRKEV